MKPWKLILAFVVVFAAGTIAGGFTALRFARPPFGPPPGASQIAEHVMHDLQNEIQFTPEQTSQIQIIVRRHAEELVSTHRELLTRMRATVEASDREVTALLDDQQKAQFEKVRAKRPPFPGSH
jgi:hypothetical protein